MSDIPTTSHIISFLLKKYFYLSWSKHTRGASSFLVHKKVHLDYVVSDQANRNHPNDTAKRHHLQYNMKELETIAASYYRCYAPKELTQRRDVNYCKLRTIPFLSFSCFKLSLISNLSVDFINYAKYFL